MQTEENKNCTHESVLAAIKAGEIKMRPRWQFILRGTLAVLGGILIALTLLYLVSLIIFASRESGAAFVSSFGFRGFFAFLMALPWLLITFSVLFIVLLEILVQRYSFAYSRPLVYSACGIIILVVAGGFVVASTSLHRGLFRQAERQELPFGGIFYKSLFERPELLDIHRGIITATTTRGFLIQDRRGRMFMVNVGSSTRRLPDERFMPKRMMVIFGDTASDTIEAFGVRPIDD
jgi:hypothetical protein